MDIAGLSSSKIADLYEVRGHVSDYSCPTTVLAK